MAWLNSWEKRVKLTIDQTDIDADLADFPVLVHLGTSVGRNADDVSFVFDELQSDANRKKIAITTSDGITECYVEIEKWDDANEQAWLWVKVPSVSGTVDTDLYLYYDIDQAENTTYVGDSGSRTEVWDDNFVGVYHLGESSGNALDSSGTGNGASVVGDGVTQGATGKISKGVDLAGTGDYLEKTSPVSMDMTANITVEMWMNADVITGAWDFYLGRTDDGGWGDGWGFWSNNDDLMHWYAGTYSTNAQLALATSEWNYWVGRHDSSGSPYLTIFKNGVTTATQTGSASFTANAGSFTIGSSGSASYDLDGKIDEVRISNVARSDAWIKASYETGRDDLLDFGSEETYVPPTIPTIQGIQTIQGITTIKF
jgi:hypothetical protein